MNDNNNQNSLDITLGSEDELTILYSYPNDPELGETLAETVAYWLKQTVERDGFATESVSLEVIPGDNYTLKLYADESLHSQLQAYQGILDQFLAMGLKMYREHILKIMQDELWDPNNKNWRFMLPLGLPLMNKKAIQFFHFPTLRLLTNKRDSLNDPVPKRVEDLAVANGASEEIIEQYMMMANSIPVAGPDDEGQLVDKMVDKFRDDFVQYDRELVEMLLNCSPDSGDSTIPIVVYGTSTRQMFNDVFGVNLSDANSTDTAHIIEGKKTAVMAMRHPFSFFYMVQKQPDPDSAVTYPGTGEYELSDATDEGFNKALVHHRNDIIGAAWMERMVQNHAADPAETYAAAKDYWEDPQRDARVKMWMYYHATMWVENGTTGTWKFEMPEICREGLLRFIADNKQYS